MTHNNGDYSAITPEIDVLAKKMTDNSIIDPSLYTKYNVKRGLRDLDGKGVLTGLTDISTIIQNKNVDGKLVPCHGELYYRGYNVNDIIKGITDDNRFGFEEVVYLLLFGEMPNPQELHDFKELLVQYRTLPQNFVRDVILKAPSEDMMNSIARSVLTLFCYDTNPNDTSISNVLRQCVQLISVFPLLSVYGYHAYNHYLRDKSLYIHRADPSMSTAEVILSLLRPDRKYTPLEAKVLDMALILHMEHGGGNNSTFTTHVVTSSGTDTYSAMAAALSSLKGPKHGGANVKVYYMFEDLKKHVRDWNDDEAISDYLEKLLNKQAFDGKGLIYGMGHAVYTISDPRQVILKGSVQKLAEAEGYDDEFKLYEKVERLAPEVIAKKRKIYKGVAANVDFYSGLLYSMLKIPCELYTPLFATARIAGWSAHRLEELVNPGKIIRPAYMSISKEKKYVPLEDR
ncbi:citrate/2-methylcitrate synthase [Ruminococcus sp.]|uniref:citrate/2-methylcitrate synthase n=1 Tax=Ruminococcus sp. TaxID=41978 RepID=UPI00262F0E63|nr:citrate/2-methylcitrate synthase [Ruminococcus sp.]MDD6988883.1 citrate/2-methylcitrate synthase [Ruminococcus sp.]MDY6201325.1 citrate/2-methylcitrate synthase [Ruminococcus sp.]